MDLLRGLIIIMPEP